MMRDQQTKRVIVVLSAGRSGTSLLMKALGSLGMKLSENMIPGSAVNPTGFYEDTEIVELHKELLKDLGTHPTLPLPDGWLESDSIKKATPKLRKILENRLTGVDGIWGFKDPRTVPFLPLWNRILNTPGVVPFFILAVRNPSAVAVSLKRQINREEEITELQWLIRTTDALHHTAADCFIVHYEDWFTQRKEQANNLLKYTGLDQYFTGTIDETLNHIIKPNLNRAIYEAYEVKNEYVLKLYDALKECRGDNFNRARLMTVVKECRNAMDGFKGWCLEAQKSIRHLEQTRELVDKEKRKVEDERRKADEQRRKADEQRRKADELEAQLNITKSSHAYRVGNTVINALRKPGWKTIRLPYDLLKLSDKSQDGFEIRKQQGGASNTSKIDSSESAQSEINSDLSAQELADAVGKKQSLSHEYEIAAEKIIDLESKLDKLVDSETASQEMTKAVLAANRLLLELKDTEDAILEWRIRNQAGNLRPQKPFLFNSRSSASTFEARNANSRSLIPQTADTGWDIRKHCILRPPNSARIRRHMQHAWKKPGKNTVLFPVRLIRHLLEVSNAKRKQKTAQ